jgi:diguanylate cyclase (GGDEF)-like protein/PAS domain S-box-containing protein
MDSIDGTVPLATWLAAPTPRDESDRLRSLLELRVLDTAPEKIFDDLTAVTARMLDAPVAAISLIDANRQWLKSGVGIDLREIPRDIAFCAHAIAQDELFEVHDTHADARFAGNPLVTRAPHVRFYAGVPLRASSGHNVGTLCVLDFRPRTLTEAQREALTALAAQAMYALEARYTAERLAQTQSHLRRVVDFNAMLAQTSEAIAVATQPTQLLQAICEIAVHRGGLSLAYVARPGTDGTFEFLASAGADAHLESLRLTTDPNTVEGQSPAGWVWRKGKPHYTSWNPDQAVLRSWRSRAHLRASMKSNATVPILRGSGVWGVLAALHADAEAFDPELQGLMVELAANIARGLDRLDVQVRERELASMQRALLDNTLAGIIMVRDRHVVGANERFAHMLGHESAQAVVGVAGRDFFPTQAEYERVGRLYSEIGHSRGVTITDVRLVRKDGREILCDAFLGRPDDSDGSVYVWTVQDVTERAHLQRRLHYEALHDPLSELPNRRALEQHVPTAIARAIHGKSVLVVGIVDLDDFKPINDTYGHEAGDALLRDYAERMRGLLREGDFLARLGGDEFVVVIENLRETPPLRELEVVLHRLHSAVDEPFSLPSGAQAVVGMTMGLAIYPDDGSDADTLLRNADAALYQAKGRKSVRSRWWQLGVRTTSDDSPESHVDPYGARAGALLGEALPNLAEAVERFLATLSVPSSLARAVEGAPATPSAAYQEPMRELLSKHLPKLFDIRETSEDLAIRSEAVGVSQALLGVEPMALIRPMAEFRRIVLESLGAARMPAGIRREIVRVIEERLQNDLQHQLKGLATTVRTYQDVLLSDALVPGVLWSDALRNLIDPIGALPGIVACEILRPNSANQFVVEAASGPRAEAVSRVLGLPEFATRLDPGEVTGQGPIALSWRTGAIQRVASYLDDPRVEHWRRCMPELGVRSLAVLPIPDPRGKPVFVLALYGACPNQFEAAWIVQTLKALQQHASRVWHLSRVPIAGAMIPQDVAHACREMLFSTGLLMYVQPVLNVQDGRCLKVEALARLRMDDGRILAPAAFLPILGDSELDHLFRSGLDQICAQLGNWDREGLTLDAALNLPPSTLLDPECTRWVRETLEHHGIEASRLTFELLESQEMDTVAQTEAIDALKAIGVQLAMDDLGAGYSSLLRLSVLPFDTIKIDQGLTSAMRRLPLQTFGMIRSILQLADDQQRRAILEGVEDLGILEAARILGVRWGQGYAFTRPMPMADFAGWLRDFSLPPTLPPITTYLGALAQHWMLAPGRAHGGSHAARQALVQFLRKAGEREGAAYRYHLVSPSSRTSLDAYKECTEWLVAKVRES